LSEFHRTPPDTIGIGGMKRTADVHRLMSFVFSSCCDVGIRSWLAAEGQGALPGNRQTALVLPRNWARPNSLIAAALYSGGKVNATVEFWFR
jgi:hypothetical protein